MATIKDIANRVHVSQTTVSRVLSKDSTMAVSAEVKEEILKVAQELNYMSPKMRRASKSEKIIIGVADWHLAKEGSSIYLSELEEELKKDLKWNVNLSLQRITIDMTGHVDGIIAFGSFQREEKEQLSKLSEAICFVNAEDQNYQYDQIVMDYEKGLSDLIGYLLDEKDYRSVGYIGGIYEDTRVRIGHRRLQSIVEILKERQCHRESYIQIGELTRESGRELASELLLQEMIPEVIIIGNEEMLEGVMEVIHEKNYRIPKDIAIVLYQDIRTNAKITRNYTVLQMLPVLVWKTAVKLLLERIVDRREDAMKIYLPTKLIPGEST